MTNLTFRIEQIAEGPLLRLQGELDETADFSGALQSLRGAVRVDLTGVKRINSCGVREWVNFIRALSSAHPVVLACCSIPFVEQLNMVHNFRGSAKIESFFAPYCCSKCYAYSVNLLTPDEVVPPKAPERRCSACGSSSLLDEIPERYLAFLEDLRV